MVYATVNNENGAPVTERSVLFVAYKTGTNNAVGALVARTNWRGRANLGTLAVSPGDYTVRAYFGQSKDLGGLLGVFDLTDQGYGGSDSAPGNLVLLSIASTLQLSIAASPAVYNAAGQTITYTYTLSNTGNVTLAGPFTVTGDRVQPPAGASSLAPNAQTQCSAPYAATQSDVDAGSIANTVTATGSYTGAPVPSDMATATVTGTRTPALSLVVTPSPTTFTDVGQPISYSYALRNSGNVTLSGPFAVTDSRVTVACPSTATLAPSTTLTCGSTASYVTKATDVQAGAVVSTATGTGRFGAQTVTSAQASASVTYAGMPTTFPTTTLAKNNYIWFNAVGTPVGRSTTTNSTLSFTNASIKLTLSPNKIVTIAVPDTLVSFSTTATNATVTVDSLGRWIVTVPAGYTGPVFLSGVPYKTTQDIVVKSGTWTGTIAQSSGCVAWKWAAAGYAGNFSSSGLALKVKPVSGATYWDASDDPNSAFDFAGHAGRPVRRQGDDALPLHRPQLVHPHDRKRRSAGGLPLGVLQEPLRGR